MTKAQKLGITKFPYQEFDSNNNIIYNEDSYGHWKKFDYDEKNRMIYVEFSNGYWKKFDWDDNLRCIYFEDYSKIEHFEYDESGNIIFNKYFYKESKRNGWVKSKYNSRNKLILVTNSEGLFEEWEFDGEDREIFYNRNGYWKKFEYDKNGNVTYHEDSTGYCIRTFYDDRRNSIYIDDSYGYEMKWSINHFKKYFSKLNLDIYERRNYT